MGEIVGAVLAGGLSRRMGSDKARLEVAGTSLVEHARAELGAVCDETVVVVRDRQVCRDLGAGVVEDRLPGEGPLAGLETALAWAAPRSVFVLACDLPRVDRDVVRQLVDGAQLETGRAAAWVARTGVEVQPLCGLYSSECGAAARALLDSGERSVRALLARVEAHEVEILGRGRVLLNVNTPADYRAATVGERRT